MRPLVMSYTDRYLDWQLGKDHPTNPVRAKLACAKLRLRAAKGGWDLREIDPSFDTGVEGVHREVIGAIQDVNQTHDPEYVKRVLNGHCGEWGRDVRPDLGTVALEMFRGTTMLVRELETAHDWGTGPAVYFNPQGAKHHAKYDRSSGFCVFNDMAWAAARLADTVGEIAYLDWDAHHGDGVEMLMRSAKRVLTWSVHDGSIWPGTGHEDDEDNLVFNDALERGAGDDALLASVADFLDLMETYKPKVLLLATGADGLDADPLTSLTYTVGGYTRAARGVAAWAAREGIPVLIGGAGGYTPLDGTPTVWASVVAEFVEAEHVA